MQKYSSFNILRVPTLMMKLQRKSMCNSSSIHNNITLCYLHSLRNELLCFFAVKHVTENLFSRYILKYLSPDISNQITIQTQRNVLEHY